MCRWAHDTHTSSVHFFEDRSTVSCGCIRCLRALPTACKCLTACVQVTSSGLRQLLALPALTELTVVAPTGAWIIPGVYNQRCAALTAAVDELRALFALHGRSLIRSRR